MNIRHFYKNKKILITGSSGFIGKILLEKLLFQFPDISRIYLIIRSKKGLSAEKRFYSEIITSGCFDRLRGRYLEEFEGFVRMRVSVLEGDVEKVNLGLNVHDYQLIASDCQIFFANAANIKFDADLDQQLTANVDATLSTLKLAQQSNAQIFIHTSTFGVNHNLPSGYVQESLHPIQDIHGKIPDYQKLYADLKNMSKQEIKRKGKDILSRYQYPNQYQFAKGLCQHLVQQRRLSMPVVVIRPTMVYSTYKEPFPGWIDVLHAGQIIFLFTGLGVMQEFLMDPHLQVDTVPGDVVVNNMIATAAFEAGQNKLTVYHVSSIQRNPILWKQMISITLQFWRAYPTPKRLSTPNAIITNNQLCIKLHFLWRQLWIWMYTKLGPVFSPGKKEQFERLRRVNQKSIRISEIYRFGFQKFWVYQTKKVDALKQWLGTECTNFIVDCADINMLHFFLFNNYGIKKFILKEQVDELPTLILQSDRIQLCPNSKIQAKL